MLNGIEQVQKSGSNSVNQQAGHDIINGIPEKELDKRIEEKCIAIGYPIQKQISQLQQQMIHLQDNLIKKQGVAEEKQFRRCNIIGKNFILKLLDESSDKKEKIFKAFEEPAMQEAFCKAEHGYAMSNDEDHLKILTDMLIDRGNISQRTNKQMLIDEAIDVLPRLTQKHLNILLFYLVLIFEFPVYDVKNTKQFIENAITQMQLIIPLKENDSNLQYLSQKQCLIMYNGLKKVKSLQQLVEDRTRLLNSGFPKEEYDKLIPIKIPEIIFHSSLVRPGNVVIDMPLNKLETILKSKEISDEKTNDIINFWHRNKGKNDTKIMQDFITNNFKNGRILFEYWENIQDYDISPLGITLASVYAKIKYGYQINWDFE